MTEISDVINKVLFESTNLQSQMESYKNITNSLAERIKTIQEKIEDKKEIESKDENEIINKLKEENQELTNCVIEYQISLKLIINKYKEKLLESQQKIENLELKHFDEQQELNDEIETLKEENGKLKTKVHEMLKVMKESQEEVDKDFESYQTNIEQLKQENESLRDLLKISGIDIQTKK
ncbi:fgfr1 oncogene partner 2 [Anaeramoeba ignava]|uniref:Fgfr1 oncogene partner 2 n=1 Tax=Anaeramoeba ignava TaxID=1746090 RepID=A0A9Q0LVR3_ANAIG|nr:fgfr1 oncogene partner 2 [Anaeramoeba ignava]|eukprot:Anaeramoba_ignava/a239288_8.p1 GENE.a239288_8~~a239288_8.p1  ORF type:complete len:180 (-),score=84.82 a239288_8:50-589(-)